MSDREKKLALLVGAAVLLWGANVGWGEYQTALQRNENEQFAAAQELSDAKTATLRGRRAQSKLRKWSKQSLPTDHDFATSLYQDWLRAQLTKAGLSVKSLGVTTPQSRSDSYQEFAFNVSATGKLAQLTDFLYDFYQSKHLHRISQTTLTPSDDGDSLTIALTVDALALPDADRAEQLAEGTLETLMQSLDEYKEVIGERNVFAKYERKSSAPAGPPRPPGSDEATKATFSGIHYGEDGWLMLVRMKESGKLYYFREGDEISIGQFRGTVEELDGDRRRAVVSTGRRRMQIFFGKTLAEAIPMRGRRG